MGGIGSGRSAGFGRRTTEACRSIDLNRLNRKGCLVPGWSGLWRWTYRDGETASIGLRAEARALRLVYRHRQGDGEWEDVDEIVPIVRTACTYGGSRPWFVCPGVVNGRVCRRRVGKLFGPGKFFLCRTCWDLRYASQREDVMDRKMRRANGLRVRLGGEPCMDGPPPPRPKGMWRRTHERLTAEILRLEAEADAAFMERAERFLATADRKQGFWS